MKSAVVGIGRIGFSLEFDKYREKPATHVGAINAHSGVKLVAVADSNASACAAFSKKFKVVPTFNSLSNMLRSTGVDCLHIATPTKAHLKILKTALQAKIPVIVLEKPVANSLASGASVLSLLQEKESISKIVVNHERRFSKNYQQVKKYISDRKFGKLLSVHAFLSEENSSNPYNVLLHDGTHMVDVIRFLCGASSYNNGYYANKVVGSKAKESEMVLQNVFKYNQMLHIHYLQKIGFKNYSANKAYVPCTLEVASGRKYFQFELRLTFTNGLIEIGNGIFNISKSISSKFYKGFRSLNAKKVPVKKTHYFSGMVQHAHHLFLNKVQPCSTFYDGMAVLALLNSVKNYSVKNYSAKNKLIAKK